MQWSPYLPSTLGKATVRVCPLQIQNFPVYHMVRGRKEKQQECYAAAVEAFRTTLKLLTTSKNQGAVAGEGVGGGICMS